jgi:two-component system chemotaxis response regulator CheY
MKSKTILVVDDSATMRMIVQATLARAGWIVRVSSNGREALTLAQSEPVHLVVTDWNMPVMGGLDFVRCLRATSLYRNVPVLVLTTEDDEGCKAAARAAGVAGWMPKPVDSHLLVDITRELLAAAADTST